jgi:hypothetical protein
VLCEHIRVVELEALLVNRRANWEGVIKVSMIIVVTEPHKLPAEVQGLGGVDAELGWGA